MDFAETLRRHWRVADSKVRAYRGVPLIDPGVHGWQCRLLALQELAKECGIELEPARCVLCGAGEEYRCGCGHGAGAHCHDSGGCQKRLLDRHLEQVKDGAR